MISIAGGCYVERCVDPPWDQLFGSGGRAAAALSALDNNVKLTTYIDENTALRWRRWLQSLASRLTIQLSLLLLRFLIIMDYLILVSAPIYTA